MSEIDDYELLEKQMAEMQKQMVDLDKKMDDLDKEMAEKDKKMAEKDKKIEEIQNAFEDYKNKAHSKRQKMDQNDLMEELNALHSNFPEEWRVVKNTLGKLYLDSKKDITKVKAFQMALLGILWSDIACFPEIRALENRITAIELSKNVINLSPVDDTWENEFDDQSRYEIIDWINQFRLSPMAKPEALISNSLWGYIIRKMFLTLEKTCNHHSNSSRLQCFAEYRASEVESLGTNFYTDYVATAGCTGIPLLLAELESRELFQRLKIDQCPQLHLGSDHKDLKKLAVQMGAVLLELIGMVRAGNVQIEISDLRIFGLLIIDTKIHCVCSRPLKFEENKFAIAFESGPMFELFALAKENDGQFNSDSDSDSINIIIEIEKETTNFEAVFETEFEKKSVQVPSKSPGRDRDYSKPLGPVNLETLKALADFLGKVHEYYSNLDDSLLNLYLNPSGYKKDPNLVYPTIIHSELHTSSGYSSQLTHAQFYNSTKMFSNMDSYAEMEIPTQFVFSTLPVIVHSKPSNDDPQVQIIRYLEGMSLSEVEQGIIQCEINDLDINRSYHRSALLLDIIMGIYMSSKSGIGFDQFTLDDITFRCGIYCIKTYSNAKPISADFTVLDSVDRFHSFYCRIFLMDRIMMEDDLKYIHLNNIESILLARTRNFNTKKLNMDEKDWIKLFTEAKEEFEAILDERFWVHQKDATWFLLKNLISALEAEALTESLPCSLTYN